MQSTRSRAGRIGALDVHNCAERRVWNALHDQNAISVTLLCLETEYTPQYTRKVLALLEKAGLAEVTTRNGLAVWCRRGEVGAVLRHVKTRSEPSGARSRRALCLRVWRLLNNCGNSLEADSIAKRLRVTGPETYTALRTLKAAGLIQFLRTKDGGERSTWESIGSPEYARTTLTRRPPSAKARKIATKTPPTKHAMINSIWALGAAASASSV